MNQQLWKRIQEFKFDKSYKDYGFAIRLATENNWSLNFTERSLLEYKKFMYMAATGGKMVSPSEIVDMIWHQHLIFTNSYKEFCKLLNKNIEHIPSTHDSDEYLTFMAAKKWTSTYYEECFGEQPKDIWEQDSFLEDLPLKRSKISIQTVSVISIIAFIGIAVPVFLALKPIFLKVEGVNFIYGYLLFLLPLLLVLELFVFASFKKLWYKLKTHNSLTNLYPSELAFLKKSSTDYLIHATVNSLLKKKQLSVVDGYKLKLSRQLPSTDPMEDMVLSIFDRTGQRVPYSSIMGELNKKPIILQIKASMKHLIQYLQNTIAFQRIYFTILTLLLAYLSIGISRLTLGVMHEKPANFLLLLIVALIFFFCWLGYRYSSYFFRKTIPTFYKKTLLKQKNTVNHEWEYILNGETALAVGFLPLVSIINKDTNGSWLSGSGCGSSCGGGCGGGCGGCGG